MGANNSELERNIHEYYDERAPEYDEIYTGGGPASISDPNAYQEEVRIISSLLPKYIYGKHLDLACGTGFWLPFYERNCFAITLVDQSEPMISECFQKIKKLGIESKTKIICADLFNYTFKQNMYDSALIGFLISHLISAQEQYLFDILRRILKQKGRFTIIDSIWNEERAITRNKTGVQKRVLNDGREFEIYKRYFEKKDFDFLAEKYGLNFTVIHEGRAFIAAVGNVA